MSIRKVKKMPKLTLVISLIVAALFDLFSMIPFLIAGPIFIFLARYVFWVKRYQSKRALLKMIAFTVFELIPVLKELPGCMLFVLTYYLGNWVYFKKKKRKARMRAVVAT
jgi:predicted membrane protein